MVSTVTATRNASLQAFDLRDAPEHDDGATIVVVKIDALGHFSSSNGQQDRTTSVITGLYTVLKTHRTEHIVKDVLGGSSRERCSSRWRQGSRQK